MALCGIYVDDYFSVGPHDIVTSFLEHWRSIWKTTDPVFLTQELSLAFQESPLNSPLLGYYFIRRPILKPSWRSVRMSLPRGREPQQESQSISTKMPSHHLT